MPIEIPLRRKYLVDRKTGYPGGERPAPKKRRKKLSDQQKRTLPPQPIIHLVVDGRTGAGVYLPTGEYRSWS